MREIVHIQAGQCGNQIGSKVCFLFIIIEFLRRRRDTIKLIRIKTTLVFRIPIEFLLFLFAY